MLRRSVFALWILAVLLAASPSPVAAGELGLGSVDLYAGVNLPSDWDTGWTVGAAVGIWEIVDGLYLYPALFYSVSEESETVRSGFATQTLTLEVRDLALGAEVRYFLNREPYGFYFGGGPYLHRLSAEFLVRLSIPPFVVEGTAEEETTEVGAIGVAGYRWRLSERLALLAEARYSTVTDFSNGQILVGLSFGR